MIAPLPIPELNAAEKGRIKHMKTKAYAGNPRRVRFATSEECHDAFLWEDTRKVDNTGCFKLNGVEYEAGIEYIGKKWMSGITYRRMTGNKPKNK